MGRSVILAILCRAFNQISTTFYLGYVGPHMCPLPWRYFDPGKYYVVIFSDIFSQTYTKSGHMQKGPLYC